MAYDRDSGNLGMDWDGDGKVSWTDDAITMAILDDMAHRDQTAHRTPSRSSSYSGSSGFTAPKTARPQAATGKRAEDVQKGGYSKGCYVATCVYGSYDCPEVWVLRRFRDFKLARSFFGALFIRLYYTLSPTIVALFGKAKWFHRMWKPVLDRMVRRLSREGFADTPYDDRTW